MERNQGDNCKFNDSKESYVVECNGQLCACWAGVRKLL